MRIHPAVQCGAVDAEQPGSFADVAGGQFQRNADIITFLFAQMLVKIEIACCEPVPGRP